MSMISPSMYSGLNSLLNINSDMAEVQKRLSTGKKELGAVQLLTVTNFTTRASALQNVNDGILTALAQVKAGTTALSTIRKSLAEALNQVKDARTSAAAVTGTSGTNTAITTGAKFSATFTKKGGGNFTRDTLITDLNINGIGFAAGDQLSIKVDSSAVDPTKSAKTVVLKIGSVAERDATSAAGLATQLADVNAKKVLRDGSSVTNTGAQTALTNATTDLGTGNLPAATPANQLNAQLVASIKTYLTGDAAGVISTKQYLDTLDNIIKGRVVFTAGQLAAGGFANAAALTAASNASVTAAKLNALSPQANAYYNALVTANAAAADFAAKDTAYTTANNAYNTNLSNAQDGSSTKPWIVATAKDYLDAISKLNDDADGGRVSYDAVMGAGANYTTFTTNATTNGDVIVNDPAAVNTHTASELQSLFQNDIPTTEPTDKTNAYKTQNWSGNLSVGLKLHQVSYTGTGATTTSVAADSKRAVAANTVRSFLDQMKQLVRDSRVNSVNLLNGEKISTTVNADGDTFNYQLVNSAGTPSSLEGMLNISLAELNLIASTSGGTTSVNKNFDNNTDMDLAITRLTSALATVDVVSADVSSAQLNLSNRSDFNSQIMKILNDSATNIQSSDSTADAAELAALQTRQQFANSILAIIKQGDQNPLQLLR